MTDIDIQNRCVGLPAQARSFGGIAQEVGVFTPAVNQLQPKNTTSK